MGKRMHRRRKMPVKSPVVNSLSLMVIARSARSSKGFVRAGQLLFPCALGRNGISTRKREGEGTTPAGRWPLRCVFYRPDRIRRPQTKLSVFTLKPTDGWCDATGDRNYNRPVQLPYPASAETLWRKDHLYDLVIVLGYNDIPRRQGRGSAIFMHLAQQRLAPTEGCIALSQTHLRLILSRVTPSSYITIKA